MELDCHAGDTGLAGGLKKMRLVKILARCFDAVDPEMKTILLRLVKHFDDQMKEAFGFPLQKQRNH